MPSKLSNHPHRGATLVETLIATAIASVLLFAIGLTYLSGLLTRGIVDAQQRLIYVDQFVFAALQTETSSMQTISSPVSGVSNELVFTDASLDTVTIAQVGTDVVLTREGNPSVTLNALGIRINTFQVTRILGDTEAVRIDVIYEVDSVRGRLIEHTTTYVFSAH